MAKRLVKVLRKQTPSKMHRTAALKSAESATAILVLVFQVLGNRDALVQVNLHVLVTMPARERLNYTVGDLVNACFTNACISFVSGGRILIVRVTV